MNLNNPAVLQYFCYRTTDNYGQVFSKYIKWPILTKTLKIIEIGKTDNGDWNTKEIMSLDYDIPEVIVMYLSGAILVQILSHPLLMSSF